MGLFDGDIVHYIQVQLNEGRKPDLDGWYIFGRDEIAEALNISKSTVSNSKDEVLGMLMLQDLGMSGYSKYSGQPLYDSLAYERGKFKFKRNPLSYNEEIKDLWAMKPVDELFAYESFDKKHRRRKNGSYDPENPYVFPWGWTDEEIEKKMADLAE